MPKYYFIDLFCGAGGVTTGVHRAQHNGENIAQVIACVNHDATAISSHAANHPNVLHYTEVFETDSPHAILIKSFMVLYGIADVKMRMLEIEELQRIQGFGTDYKLMGTKTKQKWMLGNAVECNQAKVLIEASYAANYKKELKAA